MCLACEQTGATPFEDPVVGAVRVGPGGVRFAGRDLDAAARKLPDRLPAYGPALLSKRWGSWRLARLDPGLDEQGAREVASREAIATHAPTLLGRVAYIGGPSEAPEQLVALLYCYRPPVLDELLSRSVVKLDAMLARAGVSPIAKIDPTNPREFDKLVAALRTQLQRHGVGAAKDMIDLVRDDIFARWDQDPEAKIRRLSNGLNRAARKAFGNSWTGIRGSIEATVEETHANTKRETVQKYNLAVGASLHSTDRAAIGRAVAAQAHFVRDFEGRIATGASARARETISRELRHGTGWRELGGILERDLRGYSLGQSRSYFNVVSSAVVARSRSYSQLATFRSAGFTMYIVSAVLDEKTTEICRYLDGKVLEVERGLSAFDSVDGLSNPSDVKFEQPWLRERKIRSGPDAGKGGIFIPQRDGSQLRAAVIDKPAFGTRDQVGSYRGMNANQLADASIGSPPYHGHCRSTVVPDEVSGRTKSVNIPFQFVGSPKSPSADKLAKAKKLDAEDRLRTQRAQEEIERREAQLAEGGEKMAEWRRDMIQEKLRTQKAWVEKHKAPPILDHFGDVVREITPQVNRLLAFLKNGDPRLVGQIRRVEIVRGDLPKQAGKRHAHIERDYHGGRVLKVKAEAEGAKPGEVYERANRAVDYALRFERDILKQYKALRAKGVDAKEADQWLQDVGVFSGTLKKHWSASKLKENSRLFNMKEVRKALADPNRWTPEELKTLPIADRVKIEIDDARAFVDKYRAGLTDKQFEAIKLQAAKDLVERFKLGREVPQPGTDASARWVRERAQSIILQDALKKYVGAKPTAKGVKVVTKAEADRLTKEGFGNENKGDAMTYRAPNAEDKKVIDRAWAQVKQFINRDLAKGAGVCRVAQFREDSSSFRGFYSGHEGVFATAGASGTRGAAVARHEYGHHLAKLGKSEPAADALIRARMKKYHGTEDNAPMTNIWGEDLGWKMKDYFKKAKPDGEYSVGGIGVFHPYASKVYLGSHGKELLSMGLEYLADPGTGAYHLWNADPEHGSFIFAFLAGRFIK